MTNAREGRGQGNGGKAYRESSFWDKLEQAKKEKDKQDKK